MRIKGIKKSVTLLLFSVSILSASTINITTKYGKTGGIVGPLNKTTDKVNGRDICPNDNTNANATPGCDMSDDPGYSNNGTVDDPSDDTYSGDLIVRTNDNFQAIAAWNWHGTPGGDEEKVTITGTLPLKDGKAYYEWATLPGGCDLATSSISDDRQTITCVRKDFDKNDVGTYAEDLTFNVRVLGGTPNGAKPGDIKFKVEALNADPKEDTTDGNSLIVTASPRWNLQKSRYATWTAQEYDVDGDGVKEKGWIVDYKFYIESDEVSGETDSVNPIVGNESMGKDATFTFKDDFTGLTPNTKLVECRMTGRWDRKDGYVGSTDPITYYGDGSVYGTKYPERHILATKDEQVISCSQNGSDVSVEVKHVDATLDHYPTKDYAGRDLPKNRAIASIGSITVFVPLEDVKNGEDNTTDTDDDGSYRIKNCLNSFDPTTPSGNSNFGRDTESLKDNCYSLTLYYARGDYSKRFRGGGSTNYNGKDKLDYVYGYVGSGDRSGDGMITKGGEFSTWIVTNNSGGTSFSEDTTCDVFDAYRIKLQKVGENKKYKNITNRYTGNNNLPYRYFIGRDDGNYTDGSTNEGDNSRDDAEDIFPYIVEYATGYVDDSFLPSKGGDTTIKHDQDIKRECTDSSVQWTTDFDSIKDANNGLGVTKVRIRLKPGYEHPPGAFLYFWLNHKVRDIDLATGKPMNNGDLMVNYAAHKFNTQSDWSLPSYIPGTYPGSHSGWNGDRVMYSGPKVRIKKSENRTSASPGDDVNYTLKMSYTNDTETQESGEVKVTDVLPKDFKYKQGSVEPLSEFGEPEIGDCSDVSDMNITCKDGENQVLIWDLGERQVNAPGIPDLNYTVTIGAAAKAGVNTNYVKIQSPTDASTISQRMADIGLTIDIPSSINIVKSTEENPDYPSKRERTQTPKDIWFLMDMRNGKDGNLTELDTIDILPFVGDGDEGAIKFNDIAINRKVPTTFHGTMKFKSASFGQHPNSDSSCDTSPGIHYYYTNADPKTINIAPNVGDENDLSSDKSIWCEGDENGPNGCSVNGVSLTNADVTAVRVRGATMEKQAICQFRVKVEVQNNLAGDNYSNSAGATAVGVTLPVVSNSLAVPIVGSSIGDYVWYDRNKNGIQDAGEIGAEGVVVHLLDSNGNPVKKPGTDEDYIVTTGEDGKYLFDKLNSGSYKVKFEFDDGYLRSPNAQGGDDTKDSDVSSGSTGEGTTDTITLGVDEHNPNIDLGLYTPVISGNIFDDGNGDDNVNGSKIAKPDGTALFVTLLDSNGNPIATQAVKDDGSYAFDGLDGVKANQDYKLVLSTDENATTSKLPASWNNTGEKSNNGGTGNDGKVDGVISIHVGNEDLPNNDFGINKKPVANDASKPSQVNPGGDNQVVVPDLNVTDLEDGTPTTITIKDLPNNAKLYYDGKLVTAGQVIDNFDNSKLTVDPDNGEQSVVFHYTTTDKAGVESDEATLTMPFTDLYIDGTIYDDGNNNGNVDGTAISKPSGEALYANLVDENGKVVASKEIDANGKYKFGTVDGVKPNSTFTVVLSTESNSTIPSLPTNWNNADGEVSNNQGTGIDNSVDGKVTVVVETSNVLNNDFGINKKPVANDASKPSQVNPGGDNQVVVPDLNVTDLEDGTPTTITIKTLPNNAKLYYDGKLVTAGQVIDSFDNSKLTVDPEDGEQKVEFKYTTTDEAGVESDEATVTVPFTDLMINGNVYDDGNGDNNVNGTAINKPDNKQLYAILVLDGKKVASKAISADGKYDFSTADGLEPNKKYQVVLSTDANATTPSLPVNWNNADGEKSENDKTNGNDGKADGIVEVDVKTTNVLNNDFAINKKPLAEDKTEPSQVNPGKDNQVVVPTLEGSDKESNNTLVYKITKLPTNAKLYYEGKEITEPGFIVKDPSKLTVDPEDGEQKVEFKYTTTDKAGVESDEATVTMPFSELELSGHIFQDGNGNGNIDGKAIAKADNTQLYVTLIKDDKVVASKPVSSDGTYKFTTVDGLEIDSDYKVVLSTELNSTKASLPENWDNKDGEKANNSGTGNDSMPDGVLFTSIAKSNSVNNDFGINKKPLSDDTKGVIKGDKEISNACNDKKYVVPNLHLNDTEDGKATTVVITTLPDPKTGKLYYDGVEVKAGEKIENFDNSKLMVDPTCGNQTVEFGYKVIDEAGTESEELKVMMEFVGYNKIGDTVWYDENANGIQDKGELGVVGVGVTLYDENGNVVSKTKTDKNGHYEFDKIMPGKYKVKFDLPDTYLPTMKNRGEDSALDSNINSDGYTDLIVLPGGVDDMKIDAGIICECDDYKIHPENKKSVSASAINIFGLAIMSLILVGFARREER